MQYNRILAVDPSLTCSGWALFSVSSGVITAVGKVKSLPASSPLGERLEDLQGKIHGIYNKLNIGSEDIVICESPTTMKDPRAALRVEQVRCIFEVLGRNCSASVPGRVNPRTVHRELLGLKGRQLERVEVKSSAVNFIYRTYSKELSKTGFEVTTENLNRHQDIVDAVLIGLVALGKVSSAIQSGISLDEMFQESVNKCGRGLRMKRSA